MCCLPRWGHGFRIFSIRMHIMQEQKIQVRRSYPASPETLPCKALTVHLVFGASRRRAALRSQSANAACAALSQFIGWCGPRRPLTTARLFGKFGSQQMRANSKLNTSLALCSSACIHKHQALRPNHSLNRTHCGGPSFGLEKPSPNANPPQWAG